MLIHFSLPINIELQGIRGSLVDTVTTLHAGRPGFYSWQEQRCFFLLLGPDRPGTQQAWYPVDMADFFARGESGWGVKLTIHLHLYHISAKLIGSQNKFSSLPIPFEICGRNVTVCPANMCCYRSGTSCITETLSSCSNV
jgi:hypothetical protein